MGLIDKLRAELIDIVEWVDDGQHTLVSRFPRYHNQIKYASQLIVRPGQQAIFVHQGKIADVFGPGQHRLESRNLPVLSTLQGWKYGFDSAFKAEVYFVRTTQVTDLKWGTPNPVLMRDPDSCNVRVRAFGLYTLKAVEPRTLLAELVGTDASFEADEIAELLRAIISSSFADLVAKSEIAVMDLAARYGELSEQLRQMVRQRVEDEYGLEIPQLFIVNISMPAEVEEAIDTRASIDALGDLGRFQAYQMGQALPTAAANPAGGIAGAGLGLGMGMAMAGQMAGGGSVLPGAPGPASAAPPPLPGAWHMAENGQALGPVPADQLQRFAAEGRLRADTLVWTQGMAAWTPAGQVPELAGLFQPLPPPLPDGA